MASEVIKLNLIPKGEMPVFHCSQFDNGRLITIELYRGEDAYEVPAGYIVELHCRKVDNNIVTLASTLVNTNVVTFTSTTQLTACNGKNLCEVAIKAADDYLIGTLNFWLEVEVDPLKGGINSTSEIHDLYEQIEDITAEVIGDDYYDKTEVDNLLDDKADKSTTYTKTQVDTLLTSKADKSNVYTKSEISTLLAAKADADNVYTKAQVETKLAAKADAAAVYTKDETDTLLDAKANANAVYSKVEVDAIVDDLEDAIDLKADAATTYTKTEVDTALALKANAADVYTKQEIDNKFLDIMPVDIAGPSAIANFTTALASPLVECKVGIVATGGNGTPASPIPVNGYTEANITRCGVNLWDEEWESGTINYTTGENQADANAIRSKNYIQVVPNMQFYFKANWGNAIRVRLYKSDKSYLGAMSVNSNSVVTINNANCYFIRFSSPNGLTVTTYNNDVSINYPSTDTSYHPYNGNTYTIAFGQTVYGGVLDVTRGKLHVTWTAKTISEINWSLSGGSSSPSGYLFRSPIGIAKNRERYTENNILCSIYGSNSSWWFASNVANNGMMIDDRGYIYIRDDVYDNDLAGFTTNRGSILLAYELATPFDIDLTPEVISAVVGENNVYGDTNGDTTVKFKDTIQNYIDKKVST